MRTLGRGNREADSKATKAEKARQRAAEAARRAKEAEEEAAAALREAEEAEKAERSGGADDAAETGSAEPEKPVSSAKPAKGEKSTKPEKSEKADAGTGAAGDADTDPVEDAASKADKSDKSDKVDTADDTDTVVEDTGEDGSGDGESKVDLVKAGDTDADDAEDDDEDDEDDEVSGAAKGKAKPDGRRRIRPPRLGVAAYALITVIMVLAAALGVLFFQVNELRAEEKAATQVGIAAKQAAEDLSSYDYRTLDSNLKRATNHTTGKFRKDFEKLLPQTKASAAKQQAVVQGTAVRTAVESVDGDKAIALVYLNQESAKGASGQRTPNQYTLRLVMQKTGDRWLVSDLQMI